MARIDPEELLDLATDIELCLKYIREGRGDPLAGLEDVAAELRDMGEFLRVERDGDD